LKGGCMQYRVTYVDGSEELFEADTIGDARKQAEAAWDATIRRIVVQDAPEPETVEEADDADEEDDDDGGE